LENVSTPLELDEISPPGRPPVARRKDPQHSRVTNGSALLPGVDGRSPWVRRAKDIIAAHTSDLGGIDNCSAAEYSLVRRAATLTVELERMEVRFATAGAADVEDLETYQRCANSLRRLLEAIGLQRRARDVTTPSIAEYISRAAEEAEANTE
jgi:hypothetical protein